MGNVEGQKNPPSRTEDALTAGGDPRLQLSAPLAISPTLSRIPATLSVPQIPAVPSCAGAKETLATELACENQEAGLTAEPFRVRCAKLLGDRDKQDVVLGRRLHHPGYILTRLTQAKATLVVTHALQFGVLHERYSWDTDPQDGLMLAPRTA